MIISYILQNQIDWSTIGRIWGPMGLVFVLSLIVIIVTLKFFKKMLEETIKDARTERDYMRELRTTEVNNFLTSLKYRDDKMVEQFRELIVAIKEGKHR